MESSKNIEDSSRIAEELVSFSEKIEIVENAMIYILINDINRWIYLERGYDGSAANSSWANLSICARMAGNIGLRDKERKRVISTAYMRLALFCFNHKLYKRSRDYAVQALMPERSLVLLPNFVREDILARGVTTEEGLHPLPAASRISAKRCL